MSGRDRGRGRGRGDRGRGGSDRGGGRGGDGGFRGGRGGGGGGGRGGGAPVQVYSPPGINIIPPPSAGVTKVEDLYQKNISSDLARLRLSDGFPLRPAYGTRGQKVVLWTNYFEVLPAPNAVLFRYHVSVLPTATGKKLGQIVRLLLDGPEYVEFQDDIVTDFKSTLICRRELSRGKVKTAVKYRAEGQDEPRDNATSYTVQVEHTGTLTVAELTDFLTSSNVNAAYSEKLPIIQALNILVGHYAKSSPAIATVGSSKAFALGQGSDRGDLGAGLIALRGFFSSVRVAASRILININVSHGAFYDPIPLNQMIEKYGREHRFNLFKVESFIKRLRVRTIHLKEKTNRAGQVVPRVRSIFGLATRNDGHTLDHPPRVPKHGANTKEVEFFLSDPSPATGSSSAVPGAATAPPSKASAKKGKGKKGGAPENQPSQPGSSASQGRYISVYDFFKTVHNRVIANPNIPVVNVGNRENPTYLPAEVCVIVPGQSSNSKLDPNQTQQMIRFAVRKPWDNASSITMNGPKTVGLLPTDNATLSRFGVSIPPNMITVPGRILPAPPVRYKQEKQAGVRFGSWNMENYRLNTAASLPQWSYLIISMGGSNPYNLTSLQPTITNFTKALQNVGIAAATPQRGMEVAINGPDDPALETSLKNYPFKVLLVVLPKVDTGLYNRIKFIGDVKLGIHTICVVGSKFTKDRNEQYYANVALKFNLKLGGINQLIDNANMGIISEDKTMVIGIDVTHPSPGSASNAPSVAAVVASVDRWLGQWPADLRIQESRKEMVTELDGMVASRLNRWKTQGKHASLPENLLIYRDGVSEGQYDTVIATELPLIRKACASVYPATDSKKGLPNITIIIVGKRHHTRFYPTKEADADRSGNPKNGTCVDRGITEPRNWDFFMQAHTAIQGTARPAHYYIVLDEIFTRRKVAPPHQNAADALEDLTHSMCYLFGRATKAVSICPPAYYADIVCERARCYLSGLFDMVTPGATPAQSVAGESAAGEVRAEDVVIHPNLRNTMFYI